MGLRQFVYKLYKDGMLADKLEKPTKKQMADEALAHSFIESVFFALPTPTKP